MVMEVKAWKKKMGLTSFEGKVGDGFLLVVVFGFWVFEVVFERALDLTARELVVKHHLELVNFLVFYARLRLCKE